MKASWAAPDRSKALEIKGRAKQLLQDESSSYRGKGSAGAIPVKVGGALARRGVVLKSEAEIGLMRAAGRVVYTVLRRMEELVVPGVTTADLNTEAERLIAAAGGLALFKGVENPQARFPFPAALCTSVNEELVHGIPSARQLVEGDIVSIDCGVKLAGYCGDSATTIPVGPITKDVRLLLDTTKRALEVAIAEIRPGRRWKSVARKIQSVVESAGFSVVREFVGHGIGKSMHEEPKVPNYADDRTSSGDFELFAGMVIAVEPMVNLGRPEVEYGDVDRWVVVAKDRSFTAHFEHTIAVTSSGADVLTDGR